MDIRELSDLELGDVCGGKDSVLTIKLGMFGTVSSTSSDDGKIKGTFVMYTPAKA